jgi:predicted signal transduction protein with EAL and GGDEF domain
MALLLLDLDRFKTVNESLGHSAGDILLQVAADRIKSSLAAGETVARQGRRIHHPAASHFRPERSRAGCRAHP